ncbi:omega-6 fatty acid desaturase (delta-12 desaturase) [Chitinophaga polysaccharea]|uniref:Omega-6 fatty acid desaturase (Delta-12 desaturase) n=1 Tax=Chitinophaga polysaccharea TaxID=1293035 RepID=A0A561P6A4_9BACT|nr:fatty acid desaturase [Chitinophaga polysaccharea]TWF33646.1 omega-6 fatty acid desaturase (delta-12 desaturase) [Chitinophaga polysaccharea]
MLEGKELILATKPYACENRAQSWLFTLSTLALLIVSLTGTLALPYLALRIPASILSGLLIVRMFVIYHDHQHHAILHHSAIAEAIMVTFGIYVLAPSSIWKRSHDYHHKHNSKLFSASIGSYPIITRKKFESATAAERRSYLFSRHPLTIAAGYLSMFMLGMCVQSFVSSPKKHIDSLIALLIHLGGSVAVCYFWGWESWLLFIVVPFTIACGLGAYLFYAQHNFPGVTFNVNQEWCYDKAALLSSSHMVMNPVMKWFTGNIGYHHIHHLNARIPFYRLPEVMQNIPALQHAKVTSLGFRDVCACFRLKVWDPEQDRMISLREIRSIRSALRMSKPDPVIVA